MHYVHIVALLAIAQFIYFGMLVGKARGKYGIKAPAMTGNDYFERAVRVQMNTLEQLVCFVPALLIAAVYWSQAYVAALGVVYLIGRALYQRAYINDPAKRGLGFLLTFLPTTLLGVAGLVGALMRSFKKLFKKSRKTFAMIRHEIEEHTGAQWIEMEGDRKSTRLNSSHSIASRMPSSA